MIIRGYYIHPPLHSVKAGWGGLGCPVGRRSVTTTALRASFGFPAFNLAAGV